MENGHLQRYSRHVYYDAHEQEYVALCSEFPHVSAFGDTAEEALAELGVALEGAIEVHRDEGWALPEPLAPPEPQGLPSGKFVVRLPRTLHARLVRRANRDGVSLNSVVIALLAEGDAAHGIGSRLETLTEAVQAIALQPESASRSASYSAPKYVDLTHEGRGPWHDVDRPDVDESWSEPASGAWPIVSSQPAQEVRVN